MSERKRYPSDLTDERWALIEPVITAWKAAHRSVSGHQGGYEMREIVNAILYQSRTGCQRDYLPPRSAAYYYFARWRDDGTDQAIDDLLHWHAREKRGRRGDPSLVVLDTQSLHAASSVPAETTGRDAGKRRRGPGRKRCLAGRGRLGPGRRRGRPGDLNAAVSDLQVTRKTLISLAGQDEDQPAAEPAGPSPALPDHPAYLQILTAFADLGRPLRARDLCVALDLPIVAKNTENIRSKLKRLVSRGILVETEPGLFAQPRP